MAVSALTPSANTATPAQVSYSKTDPILLSRDLVTRAQYHVLTAWPERRTFPPAAIRASQVMTRQLFAVAAALFGTLDAASAHGDLHEAIDAVSRVIADSPGDAALLLRRAELRRQHKDWSEAEADYAQAHKLKPDMEIVTFGLAQMRLAQDREKEALTLLDEFLAKRPEHAGGRALRAGILEKRGNWKKADADLAAAVTSSPEPHYATARAQLLERHGRPEAAARCLDEASRARNRVPVLEHHALEIEERAGLTDAALRRLDYLIAREPRPDIWLARKARLFEKAGRAEEARDAWQRAAAAFEKVPAHKQTSKVNRKVAAEIAAGRAGTAKVQ